MKNYKQAVHAARSKVGVKEMVASAFNLSVSNANYFYLMSCLDQYERDVKLSHREKKVVKNHHSNLAELHTIMAQAIQRGEP